MEQNNNESRKNIAEKWLDRIAEELFALQDLEGTARNINLDTPTRKYAMDSLCNGLDMCINDVSGIITEEEFKEFEKKIKFCKYFLFTPPKEKEVMKISRPVGYSSQKKIKYLEGPTFNIILQSLIDTRNKLIRSLNKLLFVKEENSGGDTKKI